MRQGNMHIVLPQPNTGKRGVPQNNLWLACELQCHRFCDLLPQLLFDRSCFANA